MSYDYDVTHDDGAEDRDWARDRTPVESLCDQAEGDLSRPDHGEQGGLGEEGHGGDGGPHRDQGDGGGGEEHGPGDQGERGGGGQQPVGDQGEAGHSHDNTPKS